jgi:hypothetical protein
MLREMDTCPRDMTWVIIEGEFSGGDTSSFRVGRFNPRYYPDLGTWYDWQIVDTDSVCMSDLSIYPVDREALYNWVAEGRVSGWAPLED